MSEVNTSGYGYQDDEEAVSKGVSGRFGLNNKTVFLTKWEYITNGGAGGAEGEALEIEFTIEGKPKGYRVFPVTKAFLPNNGGETSDPASQAMKDAYKDQNAVLTHILSKFIDKAALISALSIPGLTFQGYCQVTAGLLPAGFQTIALDMFMQWQWQFTGENTQTFLEIPRKMKHGIWLNLAVRPFDATGTQTGTWEEQIKANPADNDADALRYVDQAGNVHPFKRNGWFVKSNFAVQQREAQAAANTAMAPTAPPLPQAAVPPVPGAAPVAPPLPAAAQPVPPVAQSAAPSTPTPPAAAGW